MAFDSKQRREALQEFLDTTRLKESPWEKASGIGAGTIRAFLKGRTKSLTDGTYAKLADGASRLLNRNVTTLALRGEAQDPGESNRGFREGGGYRYEPIPVWGSEERVNGEMGIGENPTGFVRRSERLSGVAGAFAFYVHDTSMSPAIERGDQVVVNTSLPPRDGQDCVFMSKNKDGTYQAIVKRLIGYDDESWLVRQFNPLVDFRLQRKRWGRVHVISEIKRTGA